jgi:dihydroflavonol-4-reductase
MIFITGATGHIGNNLVKKIYDEKIDFRILARSIGPSIVDFKDKVIIGDVFSFSFLNEHLKENDTLVHLAAYINLKNDQKEMTERINYESVKMIADLCTEKNIFLIYTSSTDCITSEDFLVSEPDKINIDNLKGYYQISKAKATNYLLNLSKEEKLKCLILYPSAVIGINDYKPSALGKEFKRALKRKVCFYFHGGYNFVDVEDVASSIIKGINNRIIGSYIISGKYISLYQMYKLIFKTRNHHAIMIKIPIYLINLVAVIIPKYKIMIKALLTEHNFKNTGMIENLQVTPTPIEETIVKTANWFKGEL